jgi:hypothetical protein
LILAWQPIIRNANTYVYKDCDDLFCIMSDMILRVVFDHMTLSLHPTQVMIDMDRPRAKTSLSVLIRKKVIYKHRISYYIPRFRYLYDKY